MANKIDMEFRPEDLGEAKDVASKNGIEFVEVSAKTGKNVLNLFMDAAKVLEKPEDNVLLREPAIELIQPKQAPKKNDRCSC